MPIDEPVTAPVSTIRCAEIARFDRPAATCWNGKGPMRPLHVINELRPGYVLEQIVMRFGRTVGDLRELHIADIGCGAGLMCEPFAGKRSSEPLDRPFATWGSAVPCIAALRAKAGARTERRRDRAYF